MKIIAIEEHVVPRQMSDAWTRTADRQDVSVRFDSRHAARLEDIGAGRIADMVDSGVDVQVLSLPPPALQNFSADDAIPLARDFNDLLGATVMAYPTKFEGFATLPMPAPDAAATELERAVTKLGLKGALLCGRVGEQHMDDRAFDPVYAAAERLHAPLYIHPQMPHPTVLDALYTGFNPVADFMFATAAIGWHYEAGLQFVRMVMGGVFDRFPKLQVILGHWGEVVLFYLDRIALLDLDAVQLHLQRPIADYFRQNAYYTPSGMFSDHFLRWTLETVGVERIIFSQDYPYQFAGQGGARKFLETAELCEAEKAMIAHGNWETLTARTGKA